MKRKIYQKLPKGCLLESNQHQINKYPQKTSILKFNLEPAN